MAKRPKSETVDVAGARSEMTGDTTASSVDRERIARRAYELFLARGGEHGRADDDWLAAERELTPGGAERQS
jgi:hypothetical protein